MHESKRYSIFDLETGAVRGDRLTAHEAIRVLETYRTHTLVVWDWKLSRYRLHEPRFKRRTGEQVSLLA